MHLDSVQLFEEAPGVFRIMKEEKIVGTIRTGKAYDRIKYIGILQEEQGKHYAAEALYHLVPCLHSRADIIFAEVTEGQETARHILEHNGFRRSGTDGDKIFYEHHKEMAVRDDGYVPPEGCGVLYLAGGCFWGMQKAFDSLRGVVATCPGYAGRKCDTVSYEQVCRENTGERETLRVTYDTHVLSLKTLLQAYFLCIDPEQHDGQGEDIGEQYRTAVYYKDEKDVPDLEDLFQIERQRHPVFYTELLKLDTFYEAEEYHRNYLDKHPGGYCHIDFGVMEKVRRLNG